MPCTSQLLFLNNKIRKKWMFTYAWHRTGGKVMKEESIYLLLLKLPFLNWCVPYSVICIENTGTNL